MTARGSKTVNKERRGWGREISLLGTEVKIVPTRYVKQESSYMAMLRHPVVDKTHDESANDR